MTTYRTEALLALLQICDSGFPSGSFIHSYGLETLVRERIVRTPAQLEAFVSSVLTSSVVPSDAVVARRAWLAAIEGDVEAIVAVDRALLRLKAAPELRGAALATGRRLIEETAPHIGSGRDESRPYEDGAWLLHEYAARIRAGATIGMHPVAFGVVSASLGVALDDVAPALLQTTATALLQAAMRLLPVSHRDVQSILHRLRPQIAACTSDSESESGSLSAGGEGPALSLSKGGGRGFSGLACFHPLQEIASMRHARAEARLFAS